MCDLAEATQDLKPAEQPIWRLGPAAPVWLRRIWWERYRKTVQDERKEDLR